MSPGNRVRRLMEVRLQFYVSIFFAALGLGMYVYFIPIYAQSQFNATFLDLGYIGAASALTYAIVPIVVGHFTDKVNHSWFYALALVINASATITFIFARSVRDVILIRSLTGVALAFFWPSAEVMVLGLAPMDRRVKELGLYSVFWGSAFLLGPLVGGVVIQKFGFFNLFLIASMLMVFAFAQTIFFVIPHYAKKTQTLVVSSGLHLMKQLLPWYVLIACYGAIFSIFSSIFPGYANSFGVNAVLVGVIFTAFGISRVAVFATEKHYLHFGDKKTLLIVSLIISAGSLTLALLPSFSTFLVVLIVLGVCFAVVFPLSMNLISRHFPTERIGIAVGSWESVYGIGSVIGPVLGGIVAAISGIRMSFVLASFFAILMASIAVAGKTSKN